MARVVIGYQPVREAIRVHGERLDEVLVAGGRSGRRQALARFAAERGALVRQVSTRELDRLARGAQHQGMAAHAPELQIHSLHEIELNEQLAMIALDGITDPHNFGAAIRSAVALGSGVVMWGEHHSAPLTPATFRASAGAVEHACLCRVRSLRTALGELADRGVSTIALDPSAPQLLHELGVLGAAAVVVGSEDKGVGRGVRRACQHHAKLHMAGPLDSLNASVASALALYELGRR